MSERRIKTLFDAASGALVVWLIHAFQRLDRKRWANRAGSLMRKIGPLLKEHRIGRSQLRAAFPDKSDAEIEMILAGVWDNLGRVAVEFAHLDEFSIEGYGAPTADVVTYAPRTKAIYDRILESGRGAIIFAAHIANWELPGIAPKLAGVRSAVLFRRPNIGAVSDAVIKLREPLMGDLIPTTLDAPLKLARLLQSGVHVGILTDQHYTRGVEVTLFGRKCLANPLVALLARQTGAPIHGIRLVRMPDGNSFRGEITEAVEPPRNGDGEIDIQGTMQVITTVIEGWVRKHPEQWLWLHRRWR